MRRINKLYEAKAIVKRNFDSLNRELIGLKLSSRDLKEMQESYLKHFADTVSLVAKLDLMIKTTEMLEEVRS